LTLRMLLVGVCVSVGVCVCVCVCVSGLDTIAVLFVLLYLVGVKGTLSREGGNNPSVSLSSTDRNIALASCWGASTHTNAPPNQP